MKKNIMVCVTQQKTCERLIRYGNDLIVGEGDELYIIHVAHYEFKFLGSTVEGEALEYLYQKALEYGANLTVVRSNHVLDTLVDLVEKNNITHVILGESGEMKSPTNLITQFENRIKDISELIVVPAK